VQIWQTVSFLENDAIAVPPPRTRPEGGGGRYREERQGEDPVQCPCQMPRMRQPPMVLEGELSTSGLTDGVTA
jgi:hypothetical protein